VFAFFLLFFCLLALAPILLSRTPKVFRLQAWRRCCFDAVAVVGSIDMDAAVHNPVSTALVSGGAAVILAPKKRGRPTKASILQASAIVAQAATEAASASSDPVKKK
jgi:hypothetical protein